MRGTFIARTHARLSGSVSRFVETPTAVVAALVLSTSVTAISGFAVASKVWPHFWRPEVTADLAAVETRMRPLERPAARVRPLSIPSDTATVALGFTDPEVVLSLPGRLAPADEPAPAPRLSDPVRVVEGRPTVVPPLRPQPDAGLVRVARNITPARAMGLPGPSARPDTGVAETPAGLAVAAQRPSLRPSLRPATLSTRTPDVASVEETAVVMAAAASATEEVSSGPSLVRPRAGTNPCARQLTRDIPRRPGNAASGSAVMAAIGNGSGSDRDNRLVQEALRGNIPSHLRDLQPVTFDGVAAGRQTQITVCVTPDYLAIGSDSDSVRVPLGLPAALRVADAFEMMLPTTTIVDAIYRQADVRVSPSPMTPGAQMSSTEYFVRHDATVDQQFAGAGARDGLLVAGHKKDVVIANRLSRAPGRVAIYGWHRSNGSPIQPLSTVHGEYYADYSHGIRLVARTAYVNGRAVDLRALLTDGTYAEMLNSDGPLTSATIRLAALQ